jgi:NAD(P)H-dependent FMN reductase
MSKVYTIAVLVGSLRKDSINRKVAQALAELAPANLKLNIAKSAICRSTTKTSTVHRQQPTVLSVSR